MFKIKTLTILLMVLFATQVFADSTASYNSQTGALHIPKVTVYGDLSGHVYSVDMINNGGWNFSISDVEDSAVYYSRTLTGLIIDGGTRVSSGNNLQLSALALWSDGTWTDVTSMASWSENSSAISSVVQGLVTAGSVPNNTTAAISASYVFHGMSVNDSHTVTVAGDFVSRAYFELMDQDTYSTSLAPLYNHDRGGIFFDLGATHYNIYSDEFLYANTYTELVIALQNELARQGLSDSISVYLSGTFTTWGDSGKVMEGRTVVLETWGQEFSNLGFLIADNIVGEFNVYGRFYTE